MENTKEPLEEVVSNSDAQNLEKVEAFSSLLDKAVEFGMPKEQSTFKLLLDRIYPSKEKAQPTPIPMMNQQQSAYRQHRLEQERRQRPNQMR